MFVIGIILAIIAIAGVPHLILPASACVGISIFIGFIKVVIASGNAQHAADVKKMKEAGGTDAQALMYASMEAKRLNTWVTDSKK